MILDDGGDATLLVHKGFEFETAGEIPAFDEASEPEEWGVILETLRGIAASDPERWRLLGRERETRQPSASLRDGTSVHLY